ncbi:MAG: NAD(+)/NADH kinase [Planctomycetia bacterium]|jgi:NAD+ kinase
MFDSFHQNPDLPMRVVMLGYGARPGVLDAAKQLRAMLPDWVDLVESDFFGEKNLDSVKADLAIVLGGDGSILHAVHQMGYHQLPVIAVNIGRLGFLANAQLDDIPRVLDDCRNGRVKILESLMFECDVIRDDRIIKSRLGLNEVTVQNSNYSITEVDLYVDDELVTGYRCDGLIISSPIGSTAHSLSAGGPILQNNLEAFVVCPMSPHTLTHRPVIDSADRVYEVAVTGARDETAVVVDGRFLVDLQKNDRVRIRKADVRFLQVTVSGHSYYRTLREKLGWSGRLKLDEENQN